MSRPCAIADATRVDLTFSPSSSLLRPMLSRLVLQRVSLRVPTPQTATAGLRLALLARQQVVARTFLTTAHVSEPAAKDSEGTKTKKSTAKKSGTTKSAAKSSSAGRKKGATNKPKPRGRAKNPLSDELEARLKAPLLCALLVLCVHDATHLC